MELRHLRYFVAVAETGNFTRAAERCYVAQSALSVQIGRLEAEVGAALFTRTARGARLTGAGERLLPRAVQLLADAQRAIDEITAFTGLLEGRLSVGMIQGAPEPLDPLSLVRAFHATYPKVELAVRSGASAELAAAVLGGKLDLAVVALPPTELSTGLVYQHLVDDPLMAVLPKQAAARLEHPVTLRALLERGTFINYRPGSGLRHSVAQACDRAGLTIAAGFEIDQISDMVRMAAAGIGVTIVPRSAIDPFLDGSQASAAFAALPLADSRALHSVGFVHDPSLSPAGQAMSDLLLARGAGGEFAGEPTTTDGALFVN